MSIKKKFAKLMGYALIISVSYITLCVVMLCVSFMANQNGTLIKVWPISSYQKYLYFNSRRNIWQYEKGCVNNDRKLAYAPSHGSCKFNNIEFSTTLNFDSLGRFVPARIDSSLNNGIAILGDSHAMGWGVNDDETFSNVLQKKTQRPVFNLAVSSYATEREIIRLIEANLIHQLEIIIIQYSSNDMGENSQKLNYTRQARMYYTNGLKHIITPSQRNWSNHLASLLSKKTMKKTLQIPLEKIKTAINKKNFRNKGPANFQPHFNELKNVIKEYQEVLSDKRIIIFYSNGHGVKFKNFNEFSIKNMKSIEFVDLSISREMYFFLDDHLNVNGHKFVGQKLADLIDSQ